MINREKQVCALTFLPNSKDTFVCVTANQALICRLREPKDQNTRIRELSDPVTRIEFDTELKVPPSGCMLRCRALDNDRLIIFITDTTKIAETECLVLDVNTAQALQINKLKFYFSDVEIGIQYQNSNVEIYQSPFQLIHKQVADVLSRDTGSVVMSFLYPDKHSQNTAQYIRESEKARKETFSSKLEALMNHYKLLRKQKTPLEKSKDRLFSKTKPETNEKIYQALFELLTSINLPGTVNLNECVKKVKDNNPILSVILKAATDEKAQSEEVQNYRKIQDVLTLMEPTYLHKPKR